MKRRSFITNMSGMLVGSGLIFNQFYDSNKAYGEASNMAAAEPFFSRRMLTIWIEDTLTLDWAKMAHNAGINTIATHFDPHVIEAFIKTEEGQRFVSDCEKYGIGLEHWLHSYSSLLPRELFKTDPELFSMNQDGVRNQEGNFCISNKHTMKIVCENAVRYAQMFPTTTNRYYYAADDVKKICSCPKCRAFTESEKTLIVENHIVNALREHVNPEALISHPAYVYTMEAPRQIKPEPGVFLEWAPILRSYDRPITDRDAKDGRHGKQIDNLLKNIEVFGIDHAQVFEYWFDSYRASGWKTKEENWVKSPWNIEVLRQDLAFYKQTGIKSINSVVCWIDQEYVDRFGEPPLSEYGKELLSY